VSEATSVTVSEFDMQATDTPTKAGANLEANTSWPPEWVDKLLALTALTILSPLFAAIAIAVAAGSGWPIFFKQQRVGQNGKTFWLIKFRTMRGGKKGPSITARGDSRITSVGRFLRKFKLDELPQLWNVARGEMSLVGPRPEVPQFVDMNNPVWQSVLRAKPGITDPASIAFRNEEEILAKAADPIAFYESNILPAKLALNLEYLEKKSFSRDLLVIAQTARCAILPGER
jgi:lipopolysaccharide/colanic/teichoic acid biosynthesis glycosyltransferase